MDGDRIFLKRRFGLDYRVWITMLVVLLVSLGLLGYTRLRRIPCGTALVKIDGKESQGWFTCFTGKVVLFELKTDSARDVSWDFDDGSGPVSGALVSHQFGGVGEYLIKATVNHRCSYLVSVNVRRPISANDEDEDQLEIIQDPQHPLAGNKVSFYAVAPGRFTSYEWKISDPKMPVKTDSVITCSFNTPGAYTVLLKAVNSKGQTVARSLAVQVSPINPAAPAVAAAAPPPGAAAGPFPVPTDQFPGEKKPWDKKEQPSGHAANSNTPAEDASQKTQGSNAAAPPPKAADIEKPKAIATDEATFLGLVQDVVDGSREPEELLKYLDYKASTMVRANDGPEMKFTAYCLDARKRKVKLKSLKFSRDENNSIMVIHVSENEKKGGFFQKINPFKRKKN